MSARSAAAAKLRELSHSLTGKQGHLARKERPASDDWSLITTVPLARLPHWFEHHVRLPLVFSMIHASGKVEDTHELEQHQDFEPHTYTADASFERLWHDGPGDRPQDPRARSGGGSFPAGVFPPGAQHPVLLTRLKCRGKCRLSPEGMAQPAWFPPDAKRS